MTPSAAMPTFPTTAAMRALPPGALDRSPDRAFDRVLNETDAPETDRIRDAAVSLVATAFIAPILASMREHSLATGPFAPSSTEKRFGPIIDAAIAERVVGSARFPIVDAIRDRIAARSLAASGGRLDASA
ncbi:MAG: hypothetical protein KDA25_12850 [Phycisphaerales bacterium]|nr:hypothetical protein [Phycisphaerales bacterium]